jgi:uncharacterized protein YcgL (UPF0745 family)
MFDPESIKKLGFVKYTDNEGFDQGMVKKLSESLEIYLNPHRDGYYLWVNKADDGPSYPPMKIKNFVQLDLVVQAIVDGFNEDKKRK